MKVPSLILKQLYTYGSLENTAEGVSFGLKNRLSDATVTAIHRIAIEGRDIAPENLVFEMGGKKFTPADVNRARSIALSQPGCSPVGSAHDPPCRHHLEELV